MLNVSKTGVKNLNTLAALVTAKERADQVQVMNTIDAVLTAFQWSPRKSTRSASKELGTPQSAVVKISHKRLGSYRVRVVQALQRNDLLQRLPLLLKLSTKLTQLMTIYSVLHFLTRLLSTQGE